MTSDMCHATEKVSRADRRTCLYALVCRRSIAAYILYSIAFFPPRPFASCVSRQERRSIMCLLCGHVPSHATTLNHEKTCLLFSSLLSSSLSGWVCADRWLHFISDRLMTYIRSADDNLFNRAALSGRLHIQGELSTCSLQTPPCTCLVHLCVQMNGCLHHISPIRLLHPHLRPAAQVRK